MKKNKNASFQPTPCLPFLKGLLLLVSLLLSASVFAQGANKKNLTVAMLPAGAVVSGGLTWTRNNNTVPGGVGQQTDWYTANETCNALTAQGLPAGTWRLPTKSELVALYDAGNDKLRAADWALTYTWSSTTNQAGSHFYVGLLRDVVGPDNGSIRCYVTCVH